MSSRHPIITLRQDGVLHATRLLRFGASLATVLGDQPLSEDDVLEMRFELPELDTTVEGLVQIRRCNKRHDGQYATLFRIIRMRRRDQAALEDWYARTQIAISRPQHPGRALDSQVGSFSATSRPRRGGPRSLDSGVHISSMAHKRTGAGRAAIRSVLRAAGGGEGSTEPADARIQPGIRLDLARTPPVLEVEYDDHSWRRDWQDWLAQALLFVHARPPHPPLDTKLRVRIRYRPLLAFSCQGRVVNLHASGFGLQLDADPQAIAREIPGLEPVAVPQRQAPAGDHPDVAQDEAFWLQMFGLGAEPEPLEAVLAAQPDPLEPLGMDERPVLDHILADPSQDWMAKADRVAVLMREADWHWPELEASTKRADNPHDESAAFIVLAAATRQHALQQIRQAARRGTRVVVRSGEERPCRDCRPFLDQVRSPLAQAHRGLPPYHLGCRCQLVQV